MDKLRIGSYEIIEALGTGSTGMVYKASDPVIARIVAVKVMRETAAADPDMHRRFLCQARALGSLRHRNIVRLYNFGEHEGRPFIVMEYLEGRDLARILDERKELPVDKIIDMIAQAADGLHHAHLQGIVHRNIKPSHLFLLDDGTVKIIDFCLATTRDSRLVLVGQVVGTVGYMSPEQVTAANVDRRSDLFSLGCTIYEAVAHRPAFSGTSDTKVMEKTVTEDPLPLKELQGTPFEWLESVILKCLEKDPAERWQSGAELAGVLRRRMGSS